MRTRVDEPSRIVGASIATDDVTAGVSTFVGIEPELSVVEKVEGLSAKLEGHKLLELEAFEQCDVEIQSTLANPAGFPIISSIPDGHLRYLPRLECEASLQFLICVKDAMYNSTDYTVKPDARLGGIKIEQLGDLKSRRKLQRITRAAPAPLLSLWKSVRRQPPP